MNDIRNKPWMYIDDAGRLNYQCMVAFSQCTTKGELSLYELYKLMTDVAVEDFNVKNMSREMLKEHNFAILVSRTSFNIHRVPRENEIIRMTTIEEKPEPFQFIRTFEITNVTQDGAAGDSLITGITSWILIDTRARRILPIKKFSFTEPQFLHLAERPTVTYEHDCLPPKAHLIPCRDNNEGQGVQNVPQNAFKSSHKVVYSDIDVNGHTNNAKYVSIFMDELPAELQQKDFCAIKVNFAKEVMLGQTIDITGFTENNTIYIVGKVGNTTSFEATLDFKA